ncbi:uncharacterized protein LOC144451598 [Glandiceps talaboti]
MAEPGNVNQLIKGFGEMTTSNGVQNGDTKQYKTQTKIVFTPKPKPNGDTFNTPTETTVIKSEPVKVTPVYNDSQTDSKTSNSQPKSVSTSTKLVLSANKSTSVPTTKPLQSEWTPSFDIDAQNIEKADEPMENEWTPSFDIDAQKIEKPVENDWTPSVDVDAQKGDDDTLPSEWTPSFDIDAQKPDGDLYVNQASGTTAETEFIPNSGLNDDEDDENRKSVYKYDGSMVFDKSDLSEGGVPINYTDKEQVKKWDPTPLVRDMYCQTQQYKDDEDDHSSNLCRMEGYIEKLPVGQSKASLMKGWKRRYFRAKEGNLFYYDDNHTKKVSGFVQLMGSTIKDAGNKMLEILDLKGRMLLLKFGSTTELEDWKAALMAEAKEGDWKQSDSPNKAIVVVDIGTCSVRAGIIPSGDETVTAPQLFFPTICAKDKTNPSKTFYGFEALPPNVRQKSNLSFPIRHSVKMDRLGLNLEAIKDIFEKVFNDLGIDPTKYTIVMVTHRNLGVEGKVKLADILFNYFNVAGIYIQQQSVFALYSYNTTTGVIVDVGEHINVVPVVDGFILEGGVSRLFYGGKEGSDHLNRLLTESGYKSYKYSTEVETFIPRFLKEKVCYVAEDFNAEMTQCSQDAGLFTADVDLEPYELPDGTKNMRFSSARFRCCEGLFNPEMWGVDNPGIHKLIHKAIQTCSIDVRRQMCRSIYLSGGVTMTPGFAERLQLELVQLFPKSLVIQVHASAERYHAAYLGACILSSLNAFKHMCITREDYATRGPACVSKWETQ